MGIADFFFFFFLGQPVLLHWARYVRNDFPDLQNVFQIFASYVQKIKDAQTNDQIYH